MSSKKVSSKNSAAKSAPAKKPAAKKAAAKPAPKAPAKKPAAKPAKPAAKSAKPAKAAAKPAPKAPAKKPAAKPAAKPSKPAPKAATKKPAAKPAKPAAKPAKPAKAAAKPAPKAPAKKPAAKPAAKPAVKSSAKPAAKPAKPAKAAAKPAPKAPAKKPAAKPAAKPVSKPAAKPAAKSEPAAKVAKKETPQVAPEVAPVEETPQAVVEEVKAKKGGKEKIEIPYAVLLEGGKKLNKSIFFFEIDENEERANKKKVSSEMKNLDMKPTSAIRHKISLAEETQEELTERLLKELEEQNLAFTREAATQICTRCNKNLVSPEFWVDKHLGYCEECAAILKLGQSKEARKVEYQLGAMGGDSLDEAEDDSEFGEGPDAADIKDAEEEFADFE